MKLENMAIVFQRCNVLTVTFSNALIRDGILF